MSLNKYLVLVFFPKCGPVCKALIEFVTILLWFYVLVFGPEACGISAPNQGSEAHPAALGEVLTPRLPGKSLKQKLASTMWWNVGC